MNDVAWYQKFQELPETPTVSVHDKIMRRIFWRHYRLPVLAIGAGLALNLVSVSVRLSMSVMRNQLVEIVIVAVRDFELSFDYIKDFAVIIIHSIPVFDFLLLGINVALLLAVMRMARNRFPQSSGSSHGLFV